MPVNVYMLVDGVWKQEQAGDQAIPSIGLQLYKQPKHFCQYKQYFWGILQLKSRPCQSSLCCVGGTFCKYNIYLHTSKMNSFHLRRSLTEFLNIHRLSEMQHFIYIPYHKKHGFSLKYFFFYVDHPAYLHKSIGHCQSSATLLHKMKV